MHRGYDESIRYVLLCTGTQICNLDTMSQNYLREVLDGIKTNLKLVKMT